MTEASLSSPETKRTLVLGAKTWPYVQVTKTARTVPRMDRMHHFTLHAMKDNMHRIDSWSVLSAESLILLLILQMHSCTNLSVITIKYVDISLLDGMAKQFTVQLHESVSTDGTVLHLIFEFFDNIIKFYYYYYYVRITHSIFLGFLTTTAFTAFFITIYNTNTSLTFTMCRNSYCMY